MRQLFFIGFALFFFIRLEAGTGLRDISGAVKKTEMSFVSYLLRSETIKIRFPSDGQQPAPEVVRQFATPQQSMFPWFWCKEFAVLLNIFEGDIPEEFETLIHNPIGRELLYRICIELLRVNDKGESCFPDGTAREEGSIKKVHFAKSEVTESCFEEFSSSEVLFFKLLEYFYELCPKRGVEVLKNMLYATYGETKVEEWIAYYKPLWENEGKVVLFLFMGFGSSPSVEGYLPGDELSLAHYRTLERCQERFYYEILKRGYKSDSDAVNQTYKLHVALERRGNAFVVYLANGLASSCFQVLDVFDMIYKFFYESLNYFEPYLPPEFSGAQFKEKAYDRWHRLKERMHSFYAIKKRRPYACTPKTQHLRYEFHISIKEGDKLLSVELFVLSYDYSQNILYTESGEEFWAPFEAWVNRLLKEL